MDKNEKIDFYALTLYDALHSVREDHHDVVLENFFTVLQEQGDMELYSHIEERLVIELGQQQGEVDKQKIEQLNQKARQDGRLENIKQGILVHIDNEGNQ